jgi:hypothetical protein
MYYIKRVGLVSLTVLLGITFAISFIILSNENTSGNAEENVSEVIRFESLSAFDTVTLPRTEVKMVPFEIKRVMSEVKESTGQGEIVEVLYYGSKDEVLSLVVSGGFNEYEIITQYETKNLTSPNNKEITHFETPFAFIYHWLDKELEYTLILYKSKNQDSNNINTDTILSVIDSVQ